MKTQIMTVLFGVSTIFSASAKNFLVSTENQYSGEVVSSFNLKVQTSEQQDSMCGLVVSKVEMTNPQQLLEGEVLPVKELKIEFIRNPNAMCLMAFGPDRGSVNLSVGKSLPKLMGVYQLTINGEDYGLLRVGMEEGASLDLQAE